MDTWVDYATTKNIPLTEEQIKMLTPPKGMLFGELILEMEEGEKE